MTLKVLQYLLFQWKSHSGLDLIVLCYTFIVVLIIIRFHNQKTEKKTATYKYESGGRDRNTVILSRGSARSPHFDDLSDWKKKFEGKCKIYVCSLLINNDG